MVVFKIFTKNSCMRAKLIEVIRETTGKKVYAVIQGNALIVKAECADKDTRNKIKAAISDVLSPRIVSFS